MNNPFEQISSRLNTIESLLLDIKHNQSTTAPNPQEDKLLTVQEAADFLHLAKSTIYGLVSDNKIPVMKQGKRLYFSKAELEEWLKAGHSSLLGNLYLSRSKSLVDKNGK